ncbi:hypothetical protein ACTXG6_06030 [Pseudonocardia sp. Cha107L01]|uniref:hypothetical protein n=1 Tax=Pseudonocardia sp. Cha107L01 TaxID=3457576 RepID=UPI00403E40E8
MAQTSDQPFVAALNKALAGEPVNVKIAAVEAATKALSDPDVIKSLAASVLMSEPVMAKITKAAQDHARELVEKAQKDNEAFVADMKGRLDVVEKMARVGQPAVRPQPEPNPMGQRYRQLAAQTDDRVLRAGYEQLAGEHDIRSVN